jgi:periplasmic copper chaperone A
MRSLIFGVGLTAASLTAAAAPAAAPTIATSAAWARPTPPGATTGAVYVTLTNRGRVADALVSATSPAAAKVEFHSMSMAGGIMRMAPIAGPQAIGPGASLKFGPGGSHIMLIGLKGPLKAGAHVRLTLTFAKAGAVTVDAPVRADAPTADPMAGMKM